MTFYEAKTFIDIAEATKADFQIGKYFWKYSDNRGENWEEENKEEFAANLCGWYEQGGYVGLVYPSGKKESFDDLHIAPVILEDEIAVILEEFTTVGSKIYIVNPYDAHDNKTIMIVKDINYFDAIRNLNDEYSISIVYKIYDAIKNDYLVFIDGKDIYDLNKEIEY